MTALVRTLPPVTVRAKDRPEPCDLCQGQMKVQKSYVHQGKTIQHGSFKVCETVWKCAAGCRRPSGAKVTKRAGAVVQSLLPQSTVGYDVMIFVGLERFLHQRQREEIQAALLDQGIAISTGEVSKLSRKFVCYLARLHRARAAEIKAALDADGGWPLHVDATGEAGRGTMLVVLAGWRKWVLGSWKISTERADLILPCLRETVRRFGAPCAAMRDLGKAVTPALANIISELKLNIPVLACHQHFLADVGKDLLEPGHAELRGLFRRTNVRPKLRALVRDLGRELGTEIEDARQAVLEWQSLADAEHRLEPGLNGKATVRMRARTGQAGIEGFPAIGDQMFGELLYPLNSLVRIEIAYHGQQADANGDLGSWMDDFWTGAACPPDTTNPNPMQPHCPVYYASTYMP